LGKGNAEVAGSDSRKESFRNREKLDSVVVGSLVSVSYYKKRVLGR